ncbi:MAG: 3-deoxy-7-phosphoheptulonate synthase [Candidatus Auribacterota bacterium]
MIIRMKKSATQEDIRKVEERIQNAGLKASVSCGESLTIIGVIGDVTLLSPGLIEEIPGVESIMRVSKPYKLISKEFNPNPREVRVRGLKIMDGTFTIIAGPCAVESRTQMIESAKIVKEIGCEILRGGAFKPRTSPYDFQGLGEEGLKYLKEAADLTGLPMITEVTGSDKVDLIAEYADILQVGTRNMRSYDLLKQIGKATAGTSKAVLLKRGDNATIDEFLNAAEYIAKEGNENIILCLRGIRTFECAKYVRNTADIGIIPIIKQETGLPVIFDPSHSAGKRDLVLSYSLAAVAAGADGLMVETHYSPETAMCDGKQSLNAKELDQTVRMSRHIFSELSKFKAKC